MNALILFIEDDPTVVKICGRPLESLGMTIHSAPTGAGAIEMARRRQYDLAILDLGLPDMPGEHVFESLSELDRRLPIIIATGTEAVDVAVEMMKRGAHDYLMKPFPLARLEKTVLDALRMRRLESELAEMRSASGANGRDMIGDCQRMRDVHALLRKSAGYNIPVLVQGETGTGKELAARLIHAESERSAGPFMAVDCGALPETLAEDVFFGHERGAFTGAADMRRGCFERADGGTLFLDEIGNLSGMLQTKLLRVLQEQTIERLGGERPIRVDVRLISGSRIDLEAAVAAGTFRDDLWHRLNTFTVTMPPLRERGDDVLRLAHEFLEQANREFRKNVRGFSWSVRQSFVEYPWPGNVRELENVVRSAAVLADTTIDRQHLPQRMFAKAGVARTVAGAPDALQTTSLRQATRDAVASIETELIERALDKTHWNKSQAARLLDVDYKTLLTKIKEYGIGPKRA